MPCEVSDWGLLNEALHYFAAQMKPGLHTMDRTALTEMLSFLNELDKSTALLLINFIMKIDEEDGGRVLVCVMCNPITPVSSTPGDTSSSSGRSRILSANPALTTHCLGIITGDGNEVSTIL